MPAHLVIIPVFIGLALVLFSVIYMFYPAKTTLEERLESLAEEDFLPAARAGKKKPGAWQLFFDKLGRRVPLRPEEYGKYKRILISAGLRPELLPVFMGSKLFFAALVPGLYLLLLAVPTGKNFTGVVLTALILAIIGFLAPSIWLRRRVKKRQEEIFHDLPDILDLMTVCVEAGLSIDAAMIRISEDRQFAKSPLSRELKVAVQETRAGKPRHESLRDMGERTGVDDLRAFSSMLIQTVRLGTSLADSLRVYSESLRIKRSQLAEERAAKTSVKLLFPLVFFLLPAMFVVLLLPALIRLASFFSGM